METVSHIWVLQIFISIIAFSLGFADQTSTQAHYREEAGVSCISHSSVKKSEKVEFALDCTKQTEPLCIAFNLTGNMNNCELCFACPNNQAYAVWSNTKRVQAMIKPDFEKELQQGIYVFTFNTISTV